jgi:nitrogen fixation protein NifU and related proteins
MVEDELEETIKELQKKIEYDEEKTYSKVVIREYRNPTNFGVLEESDAVGIIKGPCGDIMKITLKIVKGKIQDSRFWTDGCGATLACGSMLTKMIKGKIPSEALKISQVDLINNLDGLPKEHSHCAKLAVKTMYKAIKNYNERKRMPKNRCVEC